jgi:hypothetical protein
MGNLTTLVSGSQISAFACSSLLPQAVRKRPIATANNSKIQVLYLFMAISISWWWLANMAFGEFYKHYLTDNNTYGK